MLITMNTDYKKHRFFKSTLMHLSSPFERQVAVLHDTVILSATLSILGFGFVFFNIQLAHFIEMGLVLFFPFTYSTAEKAFSKTN